MHAKKTAFQKKLQMTAAVLLLAACLVPAQAGAFGYGAKGPDVFAAQGMLKSLGYYAGPIDGIYGRQMRTGVQLFQKRYGLPVTGAVDEKTLQAILWAYAELKIPKRTEPPKQPTPTPTPPPAEPPLEPGIGAEEQQMLALINKERTSRGLKALTLDSALSNVAERKSKDMIANNYFSHQSPTYGSPFEMMKQFGIAYRSAGENIACNRSVEAAHQALMESQGHRENILNAGFTHIGLGIVDGGPCGKMFTQMFISK